MRLVDEKESHLPQDPDKKPSLYRIVMRKLLSSLLSARGLTLSIGLALFLLLSATLSLNYLDITRNVDGNGISLKNFYADARLVVDDEVETRRKIERARQNVPLRYENTAPHDKNVLTGVNDLLRDLGEIAVYDERRADASFHQARLARFENLMEDTPEAELYFNRFFRDSLNPERWNRIRLITTETLQKILRRGVTLNDYLERREGIIKDAMPRYGLTRTDEDLIYYLVDYALQPNMIVDEPAMEAARKQAEGLVEPVTRTYEKGEKIVGKGEPVQPLQAAALQKMGKAVSASNWAAGLGVSLLSLFFVLTLWSYLYTFQEREYFRPSYMALIATLTLATALLFQIMLSQSGGLSEVPIYAFPLGMFSLTVTIFTHYRVGILATTLLVFLLGLTLQVDFAQLSVLLFGSLMGIYVLSRHVNFSDRGELMHAGWYMSLANGLTILALQLLEPDFGEQWRDVLALIGWGFIGGVLSGVLTIGILPMLESAFHLVTNFTLMELSNHDKPLLKRMQFEAPGTFHHSLMVASLAEQAAEAVGANMLLTRVGCLYHDIGKMKRPLFFIENQAYFGVENPHDKLTPRLSKMVITAHPRDSLEMARQYKLPKVLQKFMTEHHGTMVAGYFYNKACIEEGVENVNKSQFRYPGPKPNIKETAIVMMADACESAVRALKTPTVSQIEERIDKIIRQRIEDGQFDECPITFKDINIIRETFVRVFRGIQHNRIEYQQNMMRELGRKLPAAAQAAASAQVRQLETALAQVKSLTDQQQEIQALDGNPAALEGEASAGESAGNGAAPADNVSDGTRDA